MIVPTLYGIRPVASSRGACSDCRRPFPDGWTLVYHDAGGPGRHRCTYCQQEHQAQARSAD